MCGFPTNPRDGFRIATATGLMSPIMAGLGLATSPGDGRRITTVAGSPTGEPGHGGLDRSMAPDSTVPSGRLPSVRSSGGAAVVASGLGLAGGGGLGVWRVGVVG